MPDKKSAEDDDALPEGLFGRWLKRGGQENWRIVAVHVDRVHAYLRQEDCRFTVGDLITLALRDHIDIITGDWNQASEYLEECCFCAVRTYELHNNMPLGLLPGMSQTPFVKTAQSSSIGQ